MLFFHVYLGNSWQLKIMTFLPRTCAQSNLASSVSERRARVNSPSWFRSCSLNSQISPPPILAPIPRYPGSPPPPAAGPVVDHHHYGGHKRMWHLLKFYKMSSSLCVEYHCCHDLHSHFPRNTFPPPSRGDKLYEYLEPGSCWWLGELAAVGVYRNE
jgi:hypothetical protein